MGTPGLHGFQILKQAKFPTQSSECWCRHLLHIGTWHWGSNAPASNSQQLKSSDDANFASFSLQRAGTQCISRGLRAADTRTAGLLPAVAAAWSARGVAPNDGRQLQAVT